MAGNKKRERFKPNFKNVYVELTPPKIGKDGKIEKFPVRAILVMRNAIAERAGEVMEVYRIAGFRARDYWGLAERLRQECFVGVNGTRNQNIRYALVMDDIDVPANVKVSKLDDLKSYCSREKWLTSHGLAVVYTDNSKLKKKRKNSKE